jgi:hypothetical protein
MTNFAPDVIIYINKLRQFINSNERAKKDLVGQSDIEAWIQECLRVATDNFKKSGDPVLSKNQFTSIREEINKVPTQEFQATAQFFQIPGYFINCLN